MSTHIDTATSFFFMPAKYFIIQTVQNTIISLLTVFIASPFIVVNIANDVTINAFHICLCANISVGSIPRRKYRLFKGRGYFRVTNVLGAATHLRPQSARSRARVHGLLCEPPELMVSAISCTASCPRPRLDCKSLGEQAGLQSMPPSRQPLQTFETCGHRIWGLRASWWLGNISEIDAQ